MNFFTQLHNSMHSIKDNNKNICLISYDELDKNHITLECGHKFNYNSIFNEVYNQKFNKNYLEIQKLSKNEIKCPYCRNIQRSILPPKDGYNKFMYVNYPLKYCMKPNICEYIFKTGKKKGLKCNSKCFKTHCSSHIRYMRSKPFTEIEKLRNEIKRLQKNNKEISVFLQKGNVCIHENCKYYSIGSYNTCYRHSKEDEKTSIKNMRNKKKELSTKIREIRNTIKYKKNNIK